MNSCFRKRKDTHMIRHLRNSEIDRSRWDECIDRSPDGLVYATSWYLDRVHPHWEALVMDDYRAVFPLPAGRKFMIPYVYTPFFVQQLGSYSCTGAVPSLTRSFLEAIPGSFRLVDLNLNRSDRPEAEGFRFARRMNLVLSLSDTYEKIRAAYSENTRRNLKKAGSAGVRVAVSGDSRRLIALFRLDRGAGLQRLRGRHYAVLEKLMNDALSEGKGSILEAGTESVPWMAGAFFLYDRRRVIFLFSGNSATGRENAALPAVIDHLVQHEAGKGQVLDFEGSDDPGLARFYAGFGATGQAYWQAYANRLPVPLRWLKNK